MVKRNDEIKLGESLSKYFEAKESQKRRRPSLVFLFTGLIIFSEDEHRSSKQIHQDFEIYSTIHNKADLLSLVESLSFSLSSELDES